MTEQIVNSAQSTLNGTINNVVTSLTVVNGAVFPASGNFRILVCDPVTFANAELMLCTARASNVLTVTRGIETTTAVGHTTGALVTHIMTVAGLTNYIAEHSISQTIADAKGDIITATAADALGRKAVGANATVLMADSSQADGLIWGGQWQAYTPTWTTTGTAPSLGNGTLTGRYTQLGKTIHAVLELVAGSSTTFGTSGWSLSLPVTSAASELGVLGMTELFDSSAGAVYAAVALRGISTTALFYTCAVPGAQVTNLVPFTWATGDLLRFKITYEAA
jgi:hypothetical protein